MRTASLTLMVLWVPLAGYAIGAAGCSGDTSPIQTGSEDSGATGSTGGQDSGGGQTQNDSGGTVGPSTDASPSSGLDSSSGVDASKPPPTDSGSGTNPTWVDMDFADGGANPNACDNHPGVACGWAATNNNLGYTCACLFPTDLDPWGCAAPDAGAKQTCSAGDGG